MRATGGKVALKTGAEGFFIGIFIIPFIDSLRSEDWQEADCEIIWSKVRSHQSDDGTTYSVDIFYEYDWQGVTHVFHFSGEFRTERNVLNRSNRKPRIAPREGQRLPRESPTGAETGLPFGLPKSENSPECTWR